MAMIARAFKRVKLPLGAYQFFHARAWVEDEGNGNSAGNPFTEGGKEPHVLEVELTTAFDEHFVNKTVTAILTEKAQRDLIVLLQANLDCDGDGKERLLDMMRNHEYGKVEL